MLLDAEIRRHIFNVDVDLYTVKKLETGGYEVEFPRADYLPRIREQLDKRYPAIKWHENACKQEAKLKVPRPGTTGSSGRYRVRTPSRQMTVQLGSAVIGERRLWVSDVKPTSSGHHQCASVWVDTDVWVNTDVWVDTELCLIYRAAHQSLQQQPLSSSPTTAEI